MFPKETWPPVFSSRESLALERYSPIHAYLQQIMSCKSGPVAPSRPLNSTEERQPKDVTYSLYPTKATGVESQVHSSNPSRNDCPHFSSRIRCCSCCETRRQNLSR
jgi:hypothetical protein